MGSNFLNHKTNFFSRTFTEMIIFATPYFFITFRGLNNLDLNFINVLCSCQPSLQLSEQSEVLRDDVEEKLPGVLADNPVQGSSRAWYSTESGGQCDRSWYHVEKLPVAYGWYWEPGENTFRLWFRLKGSDFNDIWFWKTRFLLTSEGFDSKDNGAFQFTHDRQLATPSQR